MVASITLKLSKEEVDAAIREYVERRGCRAIGAVSLRYTEGSREPIGRNTSATWSAIVTVGNLPTELEVS